MTSRSFPRRVPSLAATCALLLLGCSGNSTDGGTGGSSGTGGSAASGGTTARGGAPGSGGSTTSGGTSGNGTSGATGSGGGIGSGGVTVGRGGTIGAGGARSSGGSVGSGGTTTPGGATGSGGNSNPDGATGSAGSSGPLPSCDPSAAVVGAVVASPSGTGDACTVGSSCSLPTALGKAKGGVTVYLRGGRYDGSKSYLSVSGSGDASNWAIIAAYPCELPIVDLGASGSIGVSGHHVSFRGIAAINGSSGFGNNWTGGGTTTSNGDIEFVNCIADMNSANGIAFRSAKGVHIKQCITAHTGSSTTQSWSSGVDVFGAQGTYQDNIIEQNISFENIDNQEHTDGSGFIVDDIGTGVTFVNNIGFRNGGSCIRLTTTTGTHIINNTCYGNGLDPKATGPSTPDEIFFSSSDTTKGAVMYNNIAVATGKGGDTEAIFGSNGATLGNNVTNNTGTIDFWIDAAGTNPDFHLKATATSIIGQGTRTEAPKEDIGFDPKCITKKPPTGTDVQSWWLYSIDFDYIKGIGGIAQCFHPKARSGTPDIGAYAL